MRSSAMAIRLDLLNPTPGPLAFSRAAMLLSACGSASQDAGGARGGRGGGKGPTQVGYVVVQQGSAPMEQQLPGRVSAYQAADVRPQVSGVILRRLFREGSIVHQGQTPLSDRSERLFRASRASCGQSAERPR